MRTLFGSLFTSSNKVRSTSSKKKNAFMIRSSRLSQLALGLLALLAGSASLPAADLIYVSLSNNTIVSYDTTSNNGSAIAATASIFASTNLSNPQGLAIDTSGNL